MADLGISLKKKSKKERVLKIEWLNYTVKECVQSDRAAMPFKQIYELIRIHIFTTAIFG